MSSSHSPATGAVRGVSNSRNRATATTLRARMNRPDAGRSSKERVVRSLGTMLKVVTGIQR